jgi:two-component system, OmpR family, phosphate regulon sensor histidine kinase PhoR
MNDESMNRGSLLIAIAACVAMVIAGVNLWLCTAILMIWLATLWLARPAPTFEPQDRRRSDLSTDMVSKMIQPLESPMLVMRGERVEAANAAAQDVLGLHIVGQDARVALRHPDAIALVSGDVDRSVTIKGLTTAKSLWKLSIFRLDDRLRMVELADMTAQADISRAHTDFVANASHELRTPLASIMGYIETLGSPKAGADTATRTKFLDTMGREARRMNSLVEDLMSLSRIEAEKHDTPQEEVDLAAIADQTVRDVNAVHGRDRVKFHKAAARSVVRGDRGQLDQVIRNLIDNGMKYGAADRPISVSLSDGERGTLVLAVADEGPGIAAEHLPLLTRRFYRTDPGRSRANGGTGLGLAIVKHIVERHKGNLDIKSVVGAGTTVEISLPSS